MTLKVKNGVLTLSKEEVATIVREAANYLIDVDEDEPRDVLSYPVEVENDGIDVLGRKNVNFSLDCCANVEDDRFDVWKKQRIERGFDDTELWNLYATIMQFTIPRLKAFRDEVHGFPCSFETIEEWKNTIDEMIWSMEWYMEKDNFDCEYVKDEKGNIMVDNLTGEMIPTEDHKRAKNGWKLFTEYFLGLWD
ncbi:MAG: hypothetical protein MJZ34_08065 [Paludibacteraceae bacterium]|nr:hypothetical protein [Paludibacteraceae bacterium]